MVTMKYLKLNQISSLNYRRVTSGVVADVRDCDIIRSEFEL